MRTKYYIMLYGGMILLLLTSKHPIIQVSDTTLSTIASVSASLFGLYLASLSILVTSKQIELANSEEQKLMGFVVEFFANAIALNYLIMVYSLLLLNNVVIATGLVWVILSTVSITLNGLSLVMFIRYLQRIINTRIQNKEKIETDEEMRSREEFYGKNN